MKRSTKTLQNLIRIKSLNLAKAELGINPQSDNYAPLPSEADSSSAPLAGKTLIITGTLSSPRNEVKEKILSLGGKVSGAISKNTDFLLAGEGGGSKRDKAESLEIPIISEADLDAMGGTGPILFGN